MLMELTCPNEGCNIKMLRRALEEHKKEECMFKKKPCEYCGSEQPLPLMRVCLETYFKPLALQTNAPRPAPQHK
jgi:hypothetical protein